MKHFLSRLQLIMSNSSNEEQSYVNLNVGGQKFCTSKSTLIRGDTMLSSMFSERFPLLKETDDAIFIDRDGTHFRTILNFLRDGKIARPKSRTEIEEIKQEAEYYCIHELVECCEDFLYNDSPGAFAVQSSIEKIARTLKELSESERQCIKVNYSINCEI